MDATHIPADSRKGKPKDDLTGQVFNRWTVLSFAEIRNSMSYWKCICQCGNIGIIRKDALKRLTSQSCGCLAKELLTKHGQSPANGANHSGAYRSWAAMKARCYCSTADNYKWYGALGVTVCERWRDSFENFYADMGDRPEGLSLDRYPNPAGNYEPTNCRWADADEQANNKRSANGA